MAENSAWDFEFTTIDGQPLPLSRFKGQALLVVNTASQCGFTPQYHELEELSRAFRERGLVVLGVPCNDFGGQEPAPEAEIARFCQSNYGVDFPLTAKTRVIGGDAHPFYKWAGEKVGAVGRPKWNFHKYLVAPDGSLADWFSTVTSPAADKLTRAVEKLLPGG